MRSVCRVLVALWAASAPYDRARVSAQMPIADPTDVGTIEGIVSAFYDVISGPAGSLRQWRRDSTLYMPAATFVGTRWWITGAVWDDERPGNKLPKSWIGKREREP